jgi:hypothetical protein
LFESNPGYFSHSLSKPRYSRTVRAFTLLVVQTTTTYFRAEETFPPRNCIPGKTCCIIVACYARGLHIETKKKRKTAVLFIVSTLSSLHSSHLTLLPVADVMPSGPDAQVAPAPAPSLINHLDPIETEDTAPGPSLINHRDPWPIETEDTSLLRSESYLMGDGDGFDHIPPVIEYPLLLFYFVMIVTILVRTFDGNDP